MTNAQYQTTQHNITIPQYKKKQIENTNTVWSCDTEIKKTLPKDSKMAENVRNIGTHDYDDDDLTKC